MLIQQVKKIVGGIEGDVRKGGDPYEPLQDEGLALFSGIRIINVDAPKSMQYKITEFQRDKRSVTTAENFYSLKNAINRGPDVLAEMNLDKYKMNLLKCNKIFI